MREELEKKITRAIKFLRTIGATQENPVEVCYSGGKDSDVILQLTKESGIPYRAIYKNTTIDPPYTAKHAKEMGAEVIMPKKNFRTLMTEAGFPNRYARFCCKALKEYKILDKAIMGVRKSESTKRAKRYKEPTECRFYGGGQDNHVEAFYPILDWTDEDVADFIADRKIKCAPVYYDEMGNFHVERRLGCLCCPLKYYKKRIEDFKKYPNMVKFYIRAGEEFRKNHPNAKSVSLYSDVYEWFVRDVFFDRQHLFDDYNRQGIFEGVNYKEFLENYFNITL